MNLTQSTSVMLSREDVALYNNVVVVLTLIRSTWLRRQHGDRHQDATLLLEMFQVPRSYRGVGDNFG